MLEPKRYKVSKTLRSSVNALCMRARILVRYTKLLIRRPSCWISVRLLQSKSAPYLTSLDHVLMLRYRRLIASDPSITIVRCIFTGPWNKPSKQEFTLRTSLLALHSTLFRSQLVKAERHHTDGEDIKLDALLELTVMDDVITITIGERWQIKSIGEMISWLYTGETLQIRELDRMTTSTETEYDWALAPLPELHYGYYD